MTTRASDAEESASTVTMPTSDSEWDARSPLHFTSSIADAFSCDAIFVVGKKDAVLHENTLRALPDAIRRTVEALARDIKPGDGGAKRTSNVVMNGDDGSNALLELTVCILPDAKRLSRHNSPSGSHALFTHLSSLKAPADPKKSLGVACCLSSWTESNAVASAVARAFPTYTAKSTHASRKVKGHISVKGDVRVALIDAVSEASSSDASVEAAESVRTAAAVARGVRLAARIVDTPPAIMDPDALVREALRVVGALSEESAGIVSDDGTERGDALTVEIFRERELIERGFGGIVAVGAAAARDGREPALVHICHAGCDRDNGRSTALVGKGITFDTGGLQIKGKSGMPGMKTDLGGAAAALGAFLSCVSMDPTGAARGGGDLHLVLCIAENAVGPAGFRPDDVLIGKSGLSVEINNTDAEGRLVLADGVAYASSDLNVDDVIDMATLTGAQMVATGRFFAGIVCDDEALELRTVRAGKRSGDLCHPLPYCPEFFSKEFSSAVADMKNSVKDRSNAQASCAGQFIANHLDPNWNSSPEKKNRWLHVDIAGPSTDKSSGRGTGFGVALLVELVCLREGCL